jgi:hypothetical protein
MVLRSILLLKILNYRGGMSRKYYKKPCAGCGALFLEDPTKQACHEYIESISECWHTYSEILGREYSDPACFKVHRITVDTYAAQHIGNQKERKARQSANLHLIALYLLFGKKVEHRDVLQFLKQATNVKYEWPLRECLQWPTWMTVEDVLLATTAQEHQEVVSAWGKSVWGAYAQFHNEIIETYEEFVKNCQSKKHTSPIKR